MQDVSICLENRPGTLANMGDCLGRAGISIEGGGAWLAGERGAALEAGGIEVLEVREVVVQRLKQEIPGQSGQLTRRMADAGINIEALYSDHDHQLVLVVDKLEDARAVSAKWAKET